MPAVDWDRTAKDVLTLEWIDGTPLHDRARLEAKGFDLKHLSHAVIQTFLRHACATASSTPTCTPATCSSTTKAGW